MDAKPNFKDLDEVVTVDRPVIDADFEIWGHSLAKEHKIHGRLMFLPTENLCGQLPDALLDCFALMLYASDFGVLAVSSLELFGCVAPLLCALVYGVLTVGLLCLSYRGVLALSSWSLGSPTLSAVGVCALSPFDIVALTLLVLRHSLRAIALLSGCCRRRDFSSTKNVSVTNNFSRFRCENEVA